MEIYLIGLAVAMVGGLMLSRLTRLIHLPAVTAYLVAGLLLGPFCVGALQVQGLGFNSLHQVETMKIVSQTALPPKMAGTAKMTALSSRKLRQTFKVTACFVRLVE